MRRQYRRARFIAGRPIEWAAFERRHERFLKRYPLLRQAVALAFARTFKSANAIDPVVFYLGRVCADDFQEILLLCGNANGIAATKLLRGMFERLVTARYLHLNPSDVDNFLDYHPVAQGKLARAILDTFKDQLSADLVKTLKAAVEAGDTAKDKFMVPLCEKCVPPTMKLNYTWSKLDFVSMARKTGINIAALLVNSYYEPIVHAHATVASFATRLREGPDGSTWVFNIEPQRQESDKALMFAHNVLLRVLQVQRDHFKLDELGTMLERCEKAFLEIWNSPA